MVTTNLNHLSQILDDLVAELQNIIDLYNCSEKCAMMILHSRHTRPSVHTRSFEAILVELDKAPNVLRMINE